MKNYFQLFEKNLNSQYIFFIKIIFLRFSIKKYIYISTKIFNLDVYRYTEFDRKENSGKESIRVCYLNIDRELIVFHDCEKIAGDISADQKVLDLETFLYPESRGEERSVVLVEEFSTATMILRLRQSRLVTQHEYSCKRMRRARN